MSADIKSQQELIQETEALAFKAKSNHRMGEGYIIESNARLIESNARVEGEIGNLINELKEFGQQSSDQTKELISLTKSIKGFNQESSAQTDKLIKLTGAIKKSNTEASAQTQKLIDLTKWIVVLTVVLVIGLIVQLVTAFLPHH
jgi:ABC-type multidrug transport system fused ATPase/permease subunit